MGGHGEKAYVRSYVDKCEGPEFIAGELRDALFALILAESLEILQD